MEKIKILFSRRIFKILLWVLLFIVVSYVILVIVRVVHLLNVDKINLQVEKIHSTKLSIDDVMGKNLPPDPGLEADKTVQGIDVNNNGIRDDVELAVFKEYPNSAKTRAVLLQYAMSLQMELNQPFVTTEIATATAEKESQSYDCIGEIVPRSNNDLDIIKNYRDFIGNKQINTKERKNIKTEIDNKTRSFELKSGCDIDLLKLPN